MAYKDRGGDFSKNIVDFSAAPEYWKGKQEPGPNGDSDPRDAALHAKLDKIISLLEGQQATTQMQSGLADLARLNKAHK